MSNSSAPFRNGAFRKVIIDELLPVDADDRLLCSFSTNKYESFSGALRLVGLMSDLFSQIGGVRQPHRKGLHEGQRQHLYTRNTRCIGHAISLWVRSRAYFHHGFPEFKGNDRPAVVRTAVNVFQVSTHVFHFRTKLERSFNDGKCLLVFATGGLSEFDLDPAIPSFYRTSHPSGTRMCYAQPKYLRFFFFNSKYCRPFAFSCLCMLGCTEDEKW